jgi:hypothetical protein
MRREALRVSPEQQQPTQTHEASVMDTCYKRVGYTQALHPESRANLGCSLQDTYHCNVASNLANETAVAQAYMREGVNALTTRTWVVFMANDINPKKSNTITDKKKKGRRRSPTPMCLTPNALYARWMCSLSASRTQGPATLTTQHTLSTYLRVEEQTLTIRADHPRMEYTKRCII